MDIKSVEKELTKAGEEDICNVIRLSLSRKLPDDELDRLKILIIKELKRRERLIVWVAQGGGLDRISLEKLNNISVIDLILREYSYYKKPLECVIRNGRDVQIKILEEAS
jgi:hypothetical protein